MPTKVKFGKDVEKILNETLDSTNYRVDQVIELYYKNCDEFMEQLGDNEIEKVCFWGIS